MGDKLLEDLSPLEELKQIHEGSCGPNAQKILSYSLGGKLIPENDLCHIGGTSEEYGTSINGMLKISDILELKHYLRTELSMRNLVSCLKKGDKAILVIQAWADREIKDWENMWEFGHYVVAEEYQEKGKKIKCYDPFLGYNYNFSWNELDKRWHDHDKPFSNNIYYHTAIIYENKSNREKIIL